MQIYGALSRCSHRYAASPIFKENFELSGAAYLSYGVCDIPPKIPGYIKL